MRRLIVLLLAAWPLTALPGCAVQETPAEPPASAGPFRQLEYLAKYTQELQAVYENGMEISAEMDEAELLIDRYVDGELPESDMRGQIERLQRRIPAAIGGYRAELESIPARRRIDDPEKAASVEAFEAMVRGFAERLEEQRLLLERLMDTAVRGDESAYDLARADSLALKITMIEAENTAVEVGLLTAPPGHPQRGILHAWIGSNEAIRSAMILIEDLLRNRDPRIAEARDAIERGLERARNGIDTGRRDTSAMLARFGRTPTTQSGRIAQGFMHDLRRSFDRSFDDEAKIAAVMEKFVDTLIAAVAAPETQAASQLGAAAEAFQEEIEPLIEQRLREHKARLRMVEEFSAAIADLQ